jgi:hypothetical protein
MLTESSYIKLIGLLSLTPQIYLKPVDIIAKGGITVVGATTIRWTNLLPSSTLSDHQPSPSAD